MADNGKTWSTWLPIVISAFSTVVAIAAFTLALNPWGEVGVAENPAGFAIVRGMDPKFPGEPSPGEGLGVGPYPSDHVVMPLLWKNDTGNTIVISNPTLIFRELGRDGDPTGDAYEFVMVGELPNLSFDTLNDLSSKWPYTFTTSIVVGPHSAERSTALFRIKNWWSGPNVCLRFIPGDTYQVDIEFQRLPDPLLWGESTPESTLVKRLTIQTSVDVLTVYGPAHSGESIGWNNFSLLPGSSSTQGGTPYRMGPGGRYKEKPPCL